MDSIKGDIKKRYSIIPVDGVDHYKVFIRTSDERSSNIKTIPVTVASAKLVELRKKVVQKPFAFGDVKDLFDNYTHFLIVLEVGLVLEQFILISRSEERLLRFRAVEAPALSQDADLSPLSESVKPPPIEVPAPKPKDRPSIKAPVHAGPRNLIEVRQFAAYRESLRATFRFLGFSVSDILKKKIVKDPGVAERVFTWLLTSHSEDVDQVEGSDKHIRFLSREERRERAAYVVMKKPITKQESAPSTPAQVISRPAPSDSVLVASAMKQTEPKPTTTTQAAPTPEPVIEATVTVSDIKTTDRTEKESMTVPKSKKLTPADNVEFKDLAADSGVQFDVLAVTPRDAKISSVDLAAIIRTWPGWEDSSHQGLGRFLGYLSNAGVLYREESVTNDGTGKKTGPQKWYSAAPITDKTPLVSPSTSDKPLITKAKGKSKEVEEPSQPEPAPEPTTVDTEPVASATDPEPATQTASPILADEERVADESSWSRLEHLQSVHDKFPKGKFLLAQVDAEDHGFEDDEAKNRFFSQEAKTGEYLIRTRRYGGVLEYNWVKDPNLEKTTPATLPTPEPTTTVDPESVASATDPEPVRLVEPELTSTPVEEVQPTLFEPTIVPEEAAEAEPEVTPPIVPPQPAVPPESTLLTGISKLLDGFETRMNAEFNRGLAESTREVSALRAQLEENQRAMVLYIAHDLAARLAVWPAAVQVAVLAELARSHGRILAPSTPV